MNRRRHKRAASLTLTLLALLIAVPVGLTVRQVRQERLNRALIDAVKRNDDRAVVSLLNLGADANCQDEPPRKLSLWEVLMQVVRGRRSQPSDALTPLLIALEYRQLPDGHTFFPPENVPLVRALLDHRAQVDPTVSQYALTPLVCAIKGSKNATIRLLLTRGANVNIQRNVDHPCAPLTWACGDTDIETGVITDMLDRGADVNQRDASDDSTALFAAVMLRRIDVIRLLLDRHADVTLPGEQDLQKRTPLEQALRDDSPQSRQIVRLLKEAGAKK